MNKIPTPAYKLPTKLRVEFARCRKAHGFNRSEVSEECLSEAIDSFPWHNSQIGWMELTYRYGALEEGKTRTPNPLPHECFTV
jgi:hypothetical protein